MTTIGRADKRLVPLQIELSLARSLMAAARASAALDRIEQLHAADETPTVPLAAIAGLATASAGPVRTYCCPRCGKPAEGVAEVDADGRGFTLTCPDGCTSWHVGPLGPARPSDAPPEVAA